MGLHRKNTALCCSWSKCNSYNVRLQTYQSINTISSAHCTSFAWRMRNCQQAFEFIIFNKSSVTHKHFCDAIKLDWIGFDWNVHFWHAFMKFYLPCCESNSKLTLRISELKKSCAIALFWVDISAKSHNWVSERSFKSTNRVESYVEPFLFWPAWTS